MRTLRDILLAAAIVLAGSINFGCATGLSPSRGPVDPWVTGEDYTDSGVGCVSDCASPADTQP